GSDRLQVQRVYVQVAHDRRVDPPDQGPVRLLDVKAQVRPHDRASVGDGRVGHGQLERGDLHVALADGQVLVVARRPGAVRDAGHGVAGGVPAWAAEAELARVVEDVVHRPGAALERGGGGERLERRAGRAGALDGPVEQGVVRGRVVELGVDRLRHRLGEDVGLEGRVGAHRVDLAVDGVQG